MDKAKIAAVGAVVLVAGVGIGYGVYKHVQTQNLMTQFHKLGDINRDGIIDLKDLTLLGKALGSTPSSPNWNPNADLNGDGIVDAQDLAILQANYGLTFAVWRARMGYGSNCPSCRRSFTIQTSIVRIKEI